MKPLQTRKDSFYQECAIAMGKCSFEPEMVREFYEHWTQKNPQGQLMLFEKCRRGGCFEVSRRLATWKRNTEKWTSKPSKGSKVVYPNYYDKRKAGDMSLAELRKYKAHLESQGFKFGGGVTGQWILKPNNERIWI